jgi:hypothetical protein
LAINEQERMNLSFARKTHASHGRARHVTARDGPQRIKSRTNALFPIVQAKLRIGAPNDKFEQEADRVADEVMRMPEPEPAVHGGTAQRGCPACRGGAELSPQCEEELQRQPKEDEEELQARAAPGQTPSLFSLLEANIRSPRDGGQQLIRSQRSFFEPRFWKDFPAKSTATLQAHAQIGFGHIGSTILDDWQAAGRFAESEAIRTRKFEATSPNQTIHRKVEPEAVDCVDDPPRRIDTDAPFDEIRDADTAATSMLEEAVHQLEQARSGEADDRLLLFIYLRLKRYFGLFREDFPPPLGEELRARFGEFMVTSFLESLIIRLRDRIQKKLESGELEYECLASHCRGKDYAWSVFGKPFIHLCRRFWESDTNGRALTIIHEVYHIASEEAGDEGVGITNAHCVEGLVGSLAGSPNLREGRCKV